MKRDPAFGAVADALRLVAIDDDPMVCELLTLLLPGAGYDLTVTSDPSEAVELVRRTRPDLVICDIEMPVLDGYGVLKALQADPDTAGYPVVFLTARRTFAERVKAFRFGVVDYIAKPITPTLLFRKLERTFKGLEKRSGVAREAGPAAVDRLLQDASHDARTGIVTVQGTAGEAQIVVSGGAVVETTAPLAAGPDTTAQFRELDPRREQIVSPEALPTSVEAPGLPSFEEVPELRSALVVDDDPVFRRNIAAIMEAQGFTVHEAGDGEEGLVLALELRPWVILTDVRMPVVDGLEFCRRVRDHSLIRRTPLILLSGWDDFRERYRGLEAGADEYLSKLTPVRELLLRVHLLLRRYWEMANAGQAGEGIEGRLDLLEPAGLLQLCHVQRLTGRLKVRSGGLEMTVRLRGGEIVGAEDGTRTGRDAVYELLSWKQGHFAFSPGDPGPGEPLSDSFEQLLLDGCRLIDEGRRE